MRIRFYQINEKDNKFYKTLPTNYIFMDGTLRDSVDLSNPDIIIDISSTSNIDAYIPNGTEAQKQSMINTFKQNPFGSKNYVYIEELHRYYFITKITLLRKNILSFSLHVDVLMFWQFINIQKAFVSRNENEYNKLLPDERRIIKNTSNIEILDIIIDTEAEQQDAPDIEFTSWAEDGQYLADFYNIVALGHTTGVNREFITNGGLSKSNYLIDCDKLPKVRSGSFAVRIAKAYILNLEECAQINHYISNVHSELASSVGTIFAYPINFKTTYAPVWASMEETFSLGAQSIWDNHPVHMLQNTGLMQRYLYHHFIIPDLPQDYDFNDLSPYSEYELYIPYYGYYKLPYNEVRGHSLTIYYIINFMDGSATVQIYDRTKQELLVSLQTQLGQEISKNMSNITEVRNRHQANNTSIGFGLLTSALSIIAGVATFNPVAVAGGVLGAGKSIGDYAKNEKTNVFTTSLNFNGTSSPVYSPQELYIKKTKREIQYTLTADFLSANGGVLNELRTLSTLDGYTEIIDIPYIIMADTYSLEYTPTKDEIDEIVSKLKSGVIL